MVSPTSSTVRIERVIQECMMRHRVPSHLAMRLAYQGIFVGVLDRIPREGLPEDLRQIAITVRALEFASFAAFLGHDTGTHLNLCGGAAWETRNWMGECCRFWQGLLYQWDDLAAGIKEAERRRELIEKSTEVILSAIEDLEVRAVELKEGRSLLLATSWVRQIEGVCTSIATFWMGEEAADTFLTLLEKDARELEGFQIFYNRSSGRDGGQGI